MDSGGYCSLEVCSVGWSTGWLNRKIKNPVTYNLQSPWNSPLFAEVVCHRNRIVPVQALVGWTKGSQFHNLRRICSDRPFVSAVIVALLIHVSHKNRQSILLCPARRSYNTLIITQRNACRYPLFARYLFVLEGLSLSFIWTTVL